jgi:hypothetical protein
MKTIAQLKVEIHAKNINAMIEYLLKAKSVQIALLMTCRAIFL